MLCLSGFELYSRWVPLTALDFVLFELLLLNIIEMTMIFHTLSYFRLLRVYSIKTCFTIGINDIVASRTTASHVFRQSSLNLTETVYEKLEKHTSSREVKLLNLLVSIRKMKCNTIFIPFARYHLFILFLRFKFLLYHYSNGFLFSLTFTFFLFKFSHVIIVLYCTLFFIYVVV